MSQPGQPGSPHPSTRNPNLLRFHPIHRHRNKREDRYPTAPRLPRSTFVANLVRVLEGLDQAVLKEVDGWKRQRTNRSCSREGKRRPTHGSNRLDRTTSAPRPRNLDEDRTGANKSCKRKPTTVDSAARRRRSIRTITRQASFSELVLSDGRTDLRDPSIRRGREVESRERHKWKRCATKKQGATMGSSGVR